jgi:hypothetical protein
MAPCATTVQLVRLRPTVHSDPHGQYIAQNLHLFAVTGIGKSFRFSMARLAVIVQARHKVRVCWSSRWARPEGIVLVEMHNPAQRLSLSDFFEGTARGQSA